MNKDINNYFIGTDIVSIDRIQKSIYRFSDKFLDKFLDKDEQKLIKKVETVAGFWAAKEAISKSLGCGISKYLSFLDIKINKTPLGAPYFVLSKKAQNRFNIINSSLSISHDSKFAIAVVICKRS